MIRIVPTADKWVESFQRCLDAVARERKHIAMVEGPPVEVLRGFVGAIAGGMGVQLLAVEDEQLVVGWCDIIRHQREGFRHSGQMGMGVLERVRRQGVGRRLAAETIGKARAAGMDRIELEVFASNAPAVALYKKLGFVLEGTKRGARRIDGGVDDVLVMALLQK